MGKPVKTPEEIGWVWVTNAHRDDTINFLRENSYRNLIISCAKPTNKHDLNTLAKMGMVGVWDRIFENDNWLVGSISN